MNMNAVVTWLVENWVLLVVAGAVIATAIVKVKEWTQKPSAEQISGLKEWLVYAVAEAEHELGTKTGILKLRRVYDKAISKFLWLELIFSFEDFEELVKEALAKLKKLADENEEVKKYIEANYPEEIPDGDVEVEVEIEVNEE